MSSVTGFAFDTWGELALDGGGEVASFPSLFCASKRLNMFGEEVEAGAGGVAVLDDGLESSRLTLGPKPRLLPLPRGPSSEGGPKLWPGPELARGARSFRSSSGLRVLPELPGGCVPP
jgi:hypothetical protein